MIRVLFDLLPEIRRMIDDQEWNYQRVREGTGERRTFEFDRVYREHPDRELRIALHSMERNENIFFHRHKLPIAVLYLGPSAYEVRFGEAIGEGESASFISHARVVSHSPFAYEMHGGDSAHAVRSLGPLVSIVIFSHLDNHGLIDRAMPDRIFPENHTELIERIQACIARIKART